MHQKHHTSQHGMIEWTIIIAGFLCREIQKYTRETEQVQVISSSLVAKNTDKTAGRIGIKRMLASSTRKTTMLASKKSTVSYPGRRWQQRGVATRRMCERANAAGGAAAVADVPSATTGCVRSDTLVPVTQQLTFPDLGGCGSKL